jgi:hypothetical protein
MKAHFTTGVVVWSPRKAGEDDLLVFHKNIILESLFVDQ